VFRDLMLDLTIVNSLQYAWNVAPIITVYAGDILSMV
jgi:hypothetical protein